MLSLWQTSLPTKCSEVKDELQDTVFYVYLREWSRDLTWEQRFFSVCVCVCVVVVVVVVVVDCVINFLTGIHSVGGSHPIYQFVRKIVPNKFNTLMNPFGMNPTGSGECNGFTSDLLQLHHSKGSMPSIYIWVCLHQDKCILIG